MRTILLDTESTGFNEPQPIEIAWVELRHDLKEEADPICYQQRFRPSKPIEYGALATHHIMEEDLTDVPLHSEFIFPETVAYAVGHNVDYDLTVLGNPPVKRICTLALARFCWPELDSHSVGSLMYFFYRDSARDLLKQAHSAMADCWMTLMIFRKIIERLGIANIEHAYVLSETARIPRIMSFGKHKGLPVEQVPSSYAAWYARQNDTDPYVIKAFALAGLLP